MYRDAQTSLDERDRAVGAILIGEALISSCERAHQLGAEERPGSWRAIRDAHDDFPEIWHSLDNARSELARRGINVTGYDELRPHVRTRLATANDAEVQVDPIALDDARRAAAELRLVMPGTDWVGIEERTSDLVHEPLLRRQRIKLITTAMLVAFAVVVLSWASAIMTKPRPNPATQMRRELAQITLQRKLDIVHLHRQLGDQCEPAMAHQLARLMVMDGRFQEVKQLVGTYEGRCGDDLEMEKWATAPHPRTASL